MVYRFDRETLAGFVSPQTYLLPEGIELLSTDGTVSVVPFAEVKLVTFVRNFGPPEARKETRLFASRPKLEGLWIRMRFRDGDLLDGILPNNLLQLESSGFTIVPPDPGNLNQRIFVPKNALVEAHILGVIGAVKSRGKAAKKPTKEQLEMFGQVVAD